MPAYSSIIMPAYTNEAQLLRCIFMWTKSTHALTVWTILLLVTHTYHALKKISFFNLTSPTHWWCVHYETYSGISQYRTPLYYMYTYKLYSKWMLLTERRRFTTLLLFVISGHVGQLYTYFRRWNIWPVVWETTNGVYFRAVWKNTAHVHGIRCSPKGSHLIPLTCAVFSNTALKWTPFAYRKINCRFQRV